MEWYLETNKKHLNQKILGTIQSRKKIGFPAQKEHWNRAKAIFNKHSLRIAGHPVMEDWEQDYMEMLADIAASKGGKILELGYGLGLSAHSIQKYRPAQHLVIECHPDVIKKCVDDFREEIAFGKLHIFSGFWEAVTPSLASGIFDGILFDTYPMDEQEIHSNHFWFFKEAFRLLKPGGVLTYYSDEPRDFSKKHLEKLAEAGFGRHEINSKICKVSPPRDCEYWQHDTIMAPIVRKPL